MKILTLDLAKQTGWAVISDTGKIFSGHKKFDEMDFDGLALSFWSWIQEMLDQHEPELIAYEAPVVKHPHATKILVGLSWLVILAAKQRAIECIPVSNTAAKKHFCGRSYGKKEKPYPGIVEAQQRGLNPRSTDEADAIAILYYVSDKPYKRRSGATPSWSSADAGGRPKRSRRPSRG